MGRPGRDRTGDAFGVLRVLGPADARGCWRVRCELCEIEWVVSTKYFAGKGPTGHLVCRRQRRQRQGLP